jgi:cardiolipin synthase
VFAYLGSPNFDLRSLYLNYENAIFFYDAPAVQQVATWVERLATACVPDFFDVAKPRRWLAEQLARLVSPEI